jgi:hypothetical protein
MPRPRRGPRARRTIPLTPGIVAFFRGDPMPEEEGQDREDYVSLKFFGDVGRDGQSIPAAVLRDVYDAFVGAVE